MSSTQIVYWPAVNPRVTEEAGTRYGKHSGMDLAADLNDPVLAPFDGVVIFVGGDGASAPIWMDGWWLYPNGEGKTVDIQRADGLISRVGHLNGYAVSVGQTVKAGQTVGYAGTTGFSTGVHIHWELRWDRAWVGGNWVNPRNFNPLVYNPATNPVPAKPKKKRKTKMDYACVYRHKGGNNYAAKVFCLGNGEEHNFESTKEYIENISKTYQCYPPSLITRSHFNAIKAELADTRKRQARK